MTSAERTTKLVIRYDQAGKIARLAMGKRKNYGETRWIAEDDPLAWWLLTELIANGLQNVC